MQYIKLNRLNVVGSGSGGRRRSAGSDQGNELATEIEAEDRTDCTLDASANATKDALEAIANANANATENALDASPNANANATEDALDASPFCLEIDNELWTMLLDSALTTFLAIPDRNVPRSNNAQSGKDVTPRMVRTMKAALPSNRVVRKPVWTWGAHGILNGRVVESIATVERGHMIGARVGGLS